MIAFVLQWGYFPASGAHVGDSGVLIVVGVDGDCWSSSISGQSSIMAADLYTRAELVNPCAVANRAHGLPVRCVQELTKIGENNGVFSYLLLHSVDTYHASYGCCHCYNHFQDSSPNVLFHYLYTSFLFS